MKLQLIALLSIAGLAAAEQKPKPQWFGPPSCPSGQQPISITIDGKTGFGCYVPIAGPPGPAGRDGKDGVGVQGPVGIAGRDGANGHDGRQGEPGITQAELIAPDLSGWIPIGGAEIIGPLADGSYKVSCLATPANQLCGIKHPLDTRLTVALQSAFNPLGYGWMVFGILSPAGNVFVNNIPQAFNQPQLTRLLPSPEHPWFKLEQEQDGFHVSYASEGIAWYEMAKAPSSTATDEFMGIVGTGLSEVFFVRSLSH